MENIILYSTNCPKCKVIVKKLKQKGIDFTEIDCRADATYIPMLSGQGCTAMPDLQVGEDLLDFSKADKWIGEQ